MSSIIEVKTSVQLKAALKKGAIAKLLKGVFELETSGTDEPEIIVTAEAEFTLIANGSSQPRVEARESSQPRVIALESSQPRVVAWESSQPRVIARESSQPRVEARGSSQPRVEAWGSSQPRVEARESSQPRVVAWGSSQPRVEAWESSQPRVEARESSQPRVVAWESSQPRVEAWGSSQPRVVAWGSSQPRVEAWGSSQPRVVAAGYVQLSLFGKVHARCAATVAVLIRGAADVTGGQQTRIKLETAQEWCDYYGVEVVDGIATLYKALNDDYTDGHGMSYAPGTTPVAPDWDGGRLECGGGLHFSPSPGMALEFHAHAARFAACQVALKDFRPPKDTDEYPQKIKARGCCGPCAEVDEDGEPLTVEKKVAA